MGVSPTRYRVSFGGDENVMAAQLCEYAKKTIELRPLNGQIVYYVNYIFIKLFSPKRRKDFTVLYPPEGSTE